MSQAIAFISRVRLSRLTSDPVLRAFFGRGEDFTGDMFAVPSPRKPGPKAGASVRIPEFA